MQPSRHQYFYPGAGGIIVDIFVANDGDITILTIEGEINEHTTLALREKLDSIMKSGVSNIIVDLEKTSFISSAGLATFAFFHKQMKGKGCLKFARLPKHISNLFKLTYMNKVVDTFDSVDQAVKSFQVE